MEFITGLLWNPEFPFLTFFAPAFALAFWWVGGLWDRKERKDVVAWLKYDRSRHLYRQLITRALDAVSRFLGRREVGYRKVPDWEQVEIFERNRFSWSWGLLDFALLFAMAYPIASVIGQWVLLGQGKLGSLAILPQMSWSDRQFSLILLTFSGLTCYWASKSRTSFVYFLLSFAMIMYTFFLSELSEGALTYAIAFAGGLVIYLAYDGFKSGSNIYQVSIAFAIASMFFLQACSNTLYNIDICDIDDFCSGFRSHSWPI